VSISHSHKRSTLRLFMTHLLHHLLLRSAERDAGSAALTFLDQTLSYGEFAALVDSVTTGLLEVGIGRGDRVAFYLDKRIETVATAFGAAKAGAVFVPINPLLKGEQVGYILRDCNVRTVVTSSERLDAVASALADCPDLRHVVTLGATVDGILPGKTLVQWADFVDRRGRKGHRVIDTDMVAILYTSGSTGRPKGVVLSHRNMVMGAKSVASYLENTASDTILAALPLSFDAGFAAAGAVGKRFVALGRLLSVVPISHPDECSTMDQFAWFVGRAVRAIWAQHEDLGVGNRLADGVGSPVDLRRRKKRRTKRFGKTVHEEWLGSGQMAAKLHQRFPRHAAPSVGNVAQMVRYARRPRYLRQLYPHGRDACKAGHFFALQRVQHITRH